MVPLIWPQLFLNVSFVMVTTFATRPHNDAFNENNAIGNGRMGGFRMIAQLNRIDKRNGTLGNCTVDGER
jgi:hypothetical protein